MEHARVIYTPLHPLLYSKTEVYRGIHLLIFALKHILWVLVKTASVYPQSMFERN